jgi:hypothetical protein
MGGGFGGQFGPPQQFGGYGGQFGPVQPFGGGLASLSGGRGGYPQPMREIFQQQPMMSQQPQTQPIVGPEYTFGPAPPPQTGGPGISQNEPVAQQQQQMGQMNAGLQQPPMTQQYLAQQQARMMQQSNEDRIKAQNPYRQADPRLQPHPVSLSDLKPSIPYGGFGSLMERARAEDQANEWDYAHGVQRPQFGGRRSDGLWNA